jgi:cysteine desulfurase
MQPPIYVDHHATTPCDPRVIEKMLPYFTQHFGNPASITHFHGRKASLALEEARASVGRFFGVTPPEICFTAGATESNNIALNFLQPGEHLVTSAVEHKSILVPAERLAKSGVEITYVLPDGEGVIHPEAVREALKPNTRLVSIEAANGEIGTIQPLGAIASLCREHSILLHSDITQAAGKIPLDLADVHLASFSAHKMYGPKGVGGLLVRRGVRIVPIVAGGGQERGFRAGTVNLPGVIGLAEALKLRSTEMVPEAARLSRLRDQLRDHIVSVIDGVSVNGPRGLRLPGNLNVSFHRTDAESLILAMKRFSLSSGSACSSGERGPSRVLKAMGATDARAMASIRIGLGKDNTSEQMTMLADDLARAVQRLREISPA